LTRCRLMEVTEMPVIQSAAAEALEAVHRIWTSIPEQHRPDLDRRWERLWRDTRANAGDPDSALDVIADWHKATEIKFCQVAIRAPSRHAEAPS
jgi:hypothetical protein